MKRLFTAAIIVVLLGWPPVQAAEEWKPPPAEPVLSKNFLDEARSLLRVARASLEKWDRVPEQLSGAVYYAGVKDGALGAVVALVVVYLIFLQRKTP